MASFKLSLPHEFVVRDPINCLSAVVVVVVLIQFSFFHSFIGEMTIISLVLHLIALECLSGEDHISHIRRDAHLPFLCVKKTVEIT